MTCKIIVVILLVMIVIEEPELDRLRQRQIKDDNPVLSCLPKIQDQLFKNFDELLLFDESKWKILAQPHRGFRFLLNKSKNAGLAPSNVLPPHPALPLTKPDEHGADRPSASVMEPAREDFFCP